MCRGTQAKSGLSIVIPSASSLSLSLSPDYCQTPLSVRIVPPTLMLPPIDYQFTPRDTSQTPRISLFHYFIVLVLIGIIIGGLNLITSSGTPISPDSQLKTFLHGTAKHTDGSHIALSHSYPSVTVIFADIVGNNNSNNV